MAGALLIHWFSIDQAARGVLLVSLYNETYLCQASLLLNWFSTNWIARGVLLILVIEQDRLSQMKVPPHFSSPCFSLDDFLTP